MLLAILAAGRLRSIHPACDSCPASSGSGTPIKCQARRAGPSGRLSLIVWSHPPGSNRRPADYESAALPTELGWPRAAPSYRIIDSTLLLHVKSLVPSLVKGETNTPPLPSHYRWQMADVGRIVTHRIWNMTNRSAESRRHHNGNTDLLSARFARQD